MVTTLASRLRFLGPLIIALILTTVGVRTYLQFQPSISTGTPDGPPRIVYIKPKTSVQEIAQLLQEAGVIRTPWVFLALAYLQGSLTRLQAGEYEFTSNMSLLEILHRLETGRILTHQVTVPEGFTALDIAQLLASEQLADADRFMALVKDPTFAERLGLSVPSLEGYLFPDTYRLSRGMPEEEIIRTMVSRFREVLPSDLEAQAERLNLDAHGVITLASLIEKEAKLNSERPLVAGVFYNRLKRNMPLQSDPTAIYGAADSRRRITAIDLQRKTPYNTYLKAGLPPGPIANPGLASIRAALNPARVDYLYFVAKNDGSHFFSRTFEQHVEAVRNYQMKGKDPAGHS
ncbi:MAG TPA: endolytic transglycosylase MltG [Candidatus Methylomirabilis sp.]|nr:endolytic transglycosylase MltG [Candidatus Methylomirabilis sp.]